MNTAVSVIAQKEHPRFLSNDLAAYRGEETQRGQLLIKRSQKALLLHSAREAYTLVTDHEIPTLVHLDEVLIKVAAVGLNPVDWKAPAFNFGIPGLPWVFGRDLAGIVVQTLPSHSPCSRIQLGDVVLVPSTDYRDIRKAAFQEYAVASHFNAAKIPRNISIHQGACIGVAYVAAALALGVCFGLDFSAAMAARGPNLTRILGKVDKSTIPDDIVGECFPAGEIQHVKQGEWIAIWGASTATGYITTQLAKQCGLKVICVADISRHGRILQVAGADVLIDRFDTTRAIETIRGVTGGCLRYVLDMVGRETATILQEALCTDPDSPQAHLLGLTGVPKNRHTRIRYHAVPFKLFHICETVAEELMRWLECLLESEALIPPELIVRRDGLAGVNDALMMLRDGSASNRRIVIDLDSSGILQT
ncbi:oxidoreductase [Aspergillus similis]